MSLVVDPLSDLEAKGRDGLRVVEAASEEEVFQLVYEDPLRRTDLGKSFPILA